LEKGGLVEGSHVTRRKRCTYGSSESSGRERKRGDERMGKDISINKKGKVEGHLDNCLIVIQVKSDVRKRRS